MPFAICCGGRRARCCWCSASALAVATALALLALSRGIERSTTDSARERGADLSVTQRDASDIFSGFVDANLEPAIAAIPGVKGVGGELVMFAPVDDEYQFLAVGMADTSYFWPAMPLAEGRKPDKDERHVVMIGESVAKALGKRSGDEITIFDQKVKIVGITGYQAAVNRGVIVLRLQDLQELSFRADQVTVFHIALDPGLGADGIAGGQEKDRGARPVSVHPDRPASGQGSQPRSAQGGVAGDLADRAHHRRPQRAQRAVDVGAGAHARDRHPDGDRLERPAASWRRSCSKA